MGTDIEIVTGRRLTARDQARRDDQIIRARMRGVSWPTIAARHGLSERRCQQVMAEYRESHPTARHRSPMELLDEILGGYEAAREDLAEVAATTAHDATRVGAIRTSVAILEAQAGLLTALGVMPRVRQLALEIDVRALAHRIMGVLNEHDAPGELRDALLRALDGGDGRVLSGVR